jgi:hypothetical protein
MVHGNIIFGIFLLSLEIAIIKRKGREIAKAAKPVLEKVKIKLVDVENNSAIRVKLNFFFWGINIIQADSSIIIIIKIIEKLTGLPIMPNVLDNGSNRLLFCKKPLGTYKGRILLYPQ